ncbi:iron transport multicopper oxidase FET3 [Apiospora saccharicola]
MAIEAPTSSALNLKRGGIDEILLLVYRLKNTRAVLSSDLRGRERVLDLTTPKPPSWSSSTSRPRTRWRVGVINSGQNITVRVEEGKTYLLRVVNLGNFVGTYFEVEGHQMTIVEADGVYLEPNTVDRLYLTVAQRYAVLLTLKKPRRELGAVLMKAQLDTSMFDSIPPSYNPNFYGYLVCDEHKPLPEQNPITDLTGVNDI